MNLTKIQPYLPSKKFQKIIGVFLIVGAVITIIFLFVSKKQQFFSKNDLEINNKTIYQIIDTDTDSDGVADWEENLWGTDKNKKFTFGEESDLNYITNKKKALNINENTDDQTLTETETFAREFFTAYSALKSSEGVNEADIYSFSNALGQKIAKPDIENIYTKENLKITSENTPEAEEDYYKNISKLFNKYKGNGLGNELDIISKGLLTYQQEGKIAKYDELLLIGEDYQEFAKKAAELSVPEILSEYQLKIINDANNVGVSVINMSKVIDDPIVGLSALSSYQKYSDDLVNSVEKLEEFFQ